MVNDGNGGEHNGHICARNWKSKGENTSEDEKFKKKRARRRLM